MASLTEQFVHVYHHDVESPSENELLLLELFAPEISSRKEIEFWSPLLLSDFFDEQAKLVQLDCFTVLVGHIQALMNSTILKYDFSSRSVEENVLSSAPRSVSLLEVQAIIFFLRALVVVLVNFFFKILLLLQTSSCFLDVYHHHVVTSSNESHFHELIEGILDTAVVQIHSFIELLLYLYLCQFDRPGHDFEEVTKDVVSFEVDQSDPSFVSASRQRHVPTAGGKELAAHFELDIMDSLHASCLRYLVECQSPLEQLEVVFSLLWLPRLLELLLWSLLFVKISINPKEISILRRLVSEYDVIIDIRQVHQILSQELTPCMVLTYSILTSLIILGTKQVVSIVAIFID